MTELADSLAALDAPRRIQLRRTKGWRKPEGAIVVTRPGKWGNPFRVGNNEGRGEVGTRERAVELFRDWITHPERWALPSPPDLKPLRDHDLACWCPLGQPCHADVLLEIANRKPVVRVWDEKWNLLGSFDEVFKL